MEPEDRPEDETPLHPWLPPDDRLWRHPSELASSGSPTGPYADGSSSPGGPVEAHDTDRSDTAGSLTSPPRAGRRRAAEHRRPSRHAVTTKADRRSRPTAGATATATTSSQPASTPAATLVNEVRELDRRLWTVAVLAGVVGALVATSAVVVVGQLGRQTTVIRPVEQVVQPASTVLTLATDPRGNNIGTIAARLRPTVVELIVNDDGSNVIGSGVIFSNNGYILTDDHVVQGAASMVAVLSNGQRINARLVGGDQVTDIAVVQLRGGKPEEVATLGSSSQLQVGQLAIALGSPGGMAGTGAVTSGIISALDSQVDPADGPPLRDMIETDAPLAPGSNGGALVDANGMVIGITTSVTLSGQDSQTLSLATPIEIARDVANQLLTTGRVVHAWLGVDGTDLDVAMAQSLGIAGGAIVDSVDAGSPAARAGIVASDVITSVAASPVESMGDLDAIVRDHRPGDRVTVSYLRNGIPRSTDVVLEQQPTSDIP